MTKVTLELPEFLTVNIRGREPIQVPSADIPAEILARAVDYGFGQKANDGASSAARLAASNAGVTEEDEAKAWIKDPANAEAIRKLRVEMVNTNIEGLLGGSWTSRSPSTPGFDDRAEMTYKVLTMKGVKETLPDVLKALDATKGEPVKTRKTAVLATVESLSSKARKKLEEIVQRRLDEAADLASLT